ncbi:MAG: S24 family peptidase [Chromatiales bacterium]|nr:S24 family peptidase [Chromatiales bacterium]
MAVKQFSPFGDGEVIAPKDETPADLEGVESCEKREPYALMVLGDSMEPEFVEPEIITIEPEHPPKDGSYVVAWHDEEYIFRQLLIRDGQWIIHALNENYPDQILSGPDMVKGVITQKKSPGGRRNTKSYL